MKVQLIVVQGKPEGKTIPLAGPVFRIGRGETCHLRPNSEQVSREHAEFNISGSAVVLRDLGSRNGTLVNGKAITEPCNLKDRDLVQVGPLTFAVSIEGALAPAAQAAAPTKSANPEDVSHDDIESWLVADAKNPTPERPSGVYGGDTITIAAFKDSKTAAQPAVQPKDDETSDRADDDEYERLPEGEGDSSSEQEEPEAEEEEAVEELVDESNPFYVKKKTPGPQQPGKPTYKDTSDAANDILRKMMERRKSSK